MSEPSDARPAVGGVLCVLVVEDHPKISLYVQRLVRQALHPRRVVTIAASSAQSAVRLLEVFVVDRVVADYDLGGSTGAEVLDHVRRSAPHLLRWFVFHSGSEEPHALHDRVIPKGLQATLLREQLRQHLSEAPAEDALDDHPAGPRGQGGENSTTARIPSASS